MKPVGNLQFRHLFTLIAICSIWDLCESRKDIITTSSRDIKTRFVGTAYVTEFASQECATAKFLGIPYAEPPQRFAKPVLSTPSSGVVHAKSFGNICPQAFTPGLPRQRHKMSEDCLFLNVYVPLRNIKSQQLDDNVKSTTAPPKDSSAGPKVTRLNRSLEVPSTFVENTFSPMSLKKDSVSANATSASSNGSSKLKNFSVKNILAQMEKLEKTLLSDLERENSSEFWNTVKGTRKSSTPPAIVHETSLVLPANPHYAVLVYLHGGAYVMGSGNHYDGSVLAGHGNIIVVTINYRLGNLGFLSTNDEVIPGNLGLWDQHVAVQWVKKYIHLFGGDPNRITLGGQSAGSYSSIYQALYPGNDGLFQRVISQSGTPTAVKSASLTGYNTTLRVAKELNCDIHGSKQQVKSCLMSMSAESIVNVALPMLVPGSLPIEPTVEEPFVTEDPYKILSQMVSPADLNPNTVPHYFKNKDLLIGIDAQDGDVAIFMHVVLSSRYNRTKFNELIQSAINPELFEKLVRMYFQHDFNETTNEYLISSVLDRYIDWEHPKSITSQSRRAIDFLTDVFFAIPVLDTASAHCRSRAQTKGHDFTSNKPSKNQNATERSTASGGTFVYRFNLPEPVEGFLPFVRGTGHASELSYVFGDHNLLDGPDVALSKTVMTYWSNFVKSGNPNRESPVGTAPSPPRVDALPLWREYDNDEEYFMELSVKPETKSRMRADFRHFWTRYLPQLKQHVKEVYNEGVQNAMAVNHLKHHSNGQAVPEGLLWVVFAGMGIVLNAF